MPLEVRNSQGGAVGPMEHHMEPAGPSTIAGEVGGTAVKEEILAKSLAELRLKKEPQAATQIRDPAKRREFWKLHASGSLPQEVEDIFFSKNVKEGEKRLLESI